MAEQKRELISLIPENVQEVYRKELSEYKPPLPGDPAAKGRVKDWILNTILAGQKMLLSSTEQQILDDWNNGRLEPVDTTVNLQDILDAVKTSQVIAEETLEETRLKHEAAKREESASGFWKYIQGGFEQHLNDIIAALDSRGMLPEDVSTELKGLADKNPWVWALPIVGMYLYTLWKNTSTKLGSWGMKIEREANRKYKGNIPDWHDLLGIAFYDDDVKKQTQDLMLDLGIPEKYHTNLFKAAKTVFSINEIMALDWRGEIDRNKRLELLRKAGMEGEELDLVQKLFYNIPGIQDLISMAVREAWNDDVASSFGYDQDYPKEVEKWVVKQGYSADWLKRYWRAHWNLPAFSQGADMFHRGELSFDELSKLLRANDIPEFFREKLLNITYRLPARVDIRRFYDLGVYDLEDVYNAYRKRGYSEEDAKSYTQFTAEYYQGDNRDLTRSQIVNGYEIGVISQSDADDMLQGLGYDDDESEVILAIADAERDNRILKRRIELIRERYLRYDIASDAAAEQLTALGIDRETIDLHLEGWNLDREEKPEKPSRAVLGNWYKKGIISDIEYRDEMRSIGWDDRYIDYFIQEF